MSCGERAGPGRGAAAARCAVAAAVWSADRSGQSESAPVVCRVGRTGTRATTRFTARPREAEPARPVPAAWSASARATLRREEQRYELTAAERLCPACGSTRPEIGVETTSQYDYKPAEVFVIEHQRVKYACKCCAAEVVLAPSRRSRWTKGCRAPDCWRRLSWTSIRITCRCTAPSSGSTGWERSCRGPQCVTGWRPVRYC